MSFGGIVGVFEKREVHLVFSFAFGAAIFHREPPATLFEGQNVDGYGGVEFFEKGYLFCLNKKIQPLDFERVFLIFILRQTLRVMSGWVYRRQHAPNETFFVIVLDVDETVFVRQNVRRANERGAVQRMVRMNG